MGKSKKRQFAGNPHYQARTESANVRIDYVCVGVILIAALVLILSNLGNQYFWGDEAATALVSGTILSHGVPMGTDGTNYFSQLSGAECTKSMVWVWHPWFPFYLVSGFYAVLGTSPLTARLPFALLGVATVVLAFFFGKSLWRSRQAGIFSAALLLVSVPFLILVRQCRYYSPEMLLSLLGLYGYYRLIEGKRHSSLLLGCSAALLFYTHYVQCAALLATVIIHSAIYHRRLVRPVLLTSAVVAMCGAPWIIMFHEQSTMLGSYGSLSARCVTATGVYLRNIGDYIFHPALLLLPVFLGVGCYRRTNRLPAYDRDFCGRMCMLVIFVVLTVLGAALTGQYVAFRYICPVIPVACLIAGLLLSMVSRTHIALGAVLLVGIAYWLGIHHYTYEITHNYDGPTEGIACYLNENGSSSDVVAVNHEDLPLKFHTKMRVVSGVTGEDWSAAENADWVVIHRYASSVERRFTSHLIRVLRSGNYRPIELDYPDLPFENREEPSLHHFRTVTDAPKVVVFQRVSDGD